ncbi:MAG TPA: hypothetical protein V6D17_06625, partial [Candidatus Obscuribacterales bacterium]
PPVPPQLRAGNRFDDRLLPQMRAKTEWYRIPKWFAGHWQRRKVTEKVKGYLMPVTRADVRIREFGFQSDATGRIWHLVRTPFPITVDQPFQVNHHVVTREEPVSVTRDQVVLRTVSTVWMVSKSTGMIANVAQVDQIDTFMPNDKGELIARSSVANYDQYGRLVRESEVRWTDRLVASYQPVDFYQGVNIKASFADFLQARGMADRIPGGSYGFASSGNSGFADTGKVSGTTFNTSSGVAGGSGQRTTANTNIEPVVSRSGTALDTEMDTGTRNDGGNAAQGSAPPKVNAGPEVSPDPAPQPSVKRMIP